MLNRHQKCAADILANRRFLLPLFLSLGIVIIFSSCSTDNKAWESAQAKKTVDAYEQFYKEHPKSKYAQKAVDEVWRLTEAKNTIEGYDFFLSKHSSDPSASKAKANIQKLWTDVTPKAPTCNINSNMTVGLEWPAVPGAQSYIVYWSQQKNFSKDKKNSAPCQRTSMDHKLRVGQYAAKLPMYYKISAVREGIETNLSDSCYASLLPHKGGKYCQICGSKSVGFCHLRGIYVCSGHDTFTSDNGTNWRCP